MWKWCSKCWKRQSTKIKACGARAPAVQGALIVRGGSMVLRAEDLLLILKLPKAMIDNSGLKLTVREDLRN